MSAVKRAKWIEGITQSNRILRDIAEIVTTANRDEEGIVAEENWSLVYPRPFEEFSIVRGELVQDKTQTRFYKPVISHTERVVLYDTTPVTLAKTDVIEETVIVKSEDLVTIYKADTDYTVDAANRTVTRIDGGGINTSDEVVVSYGTKVHRILDSVSVKVEKVLTVANPDREIDPTEYTLDLSTKTVTFNTAAPTDAAHFALTFTEVQGPYTRSEVDMLKLEPDLLDPNGLTFKLPSSSGEIGVYPVDSRVVASAVTGKIGTGSGGAIQYELDELAHKVTFLAGVPTVSDNQGLFISVYESFDPPVNSDWRPKRFEIIPDLTSGAATGQFRIIGAVNRLNEGLPHSVEMDTETTKPVLFKHLSSLHAGYEELPKSAYNVNYEDPKVTVLLDLEEKLRLTFTARGEDDLAKGLAKIKDRMVLKTITQPEQLFEDVVGTDYGATDSAQTLEMFVEITKPQRLVNPETGLTRYVDHKGMQHETQINNHYIQTRMFDRWNDEAQKPQDATYNADNTLISKGSYVSDWSKYAWFKDWKEFMVDELDEDAGTANVADGIIFKEVSTTGMTDEFPVQFWISTNNNRISMVLMGDPTLDQDNFLTSFAYIGRIHPFYDKLCVVKKDESGIVLVDASGDPIIEEKRTYFQNDVAGNFAMTTGSSTLPVAIGAPPNGQAAIDKVEIAVDSTGVRAIGELYDFTSFAYVVTYLTEVGESRPTPLDQGRLLVARGELDPLAIIPSIGIALKVRFRLPEEATGYRIYRFHDAGRNAFGSEANLHTNYKLVTSVTKLDRSRTIEYVDNGTILPMQSAKYDPISDSTTYTLVNTSWETFYAKFVAAVPSARSFEAVVRDKFTGAMLDVKFSEKWGKDTATGVNDIMMFATRSGLKYQRHNASFITTEEFMRKEKSGQSRWTGKFHLSPIYIEHSYDKQRGWLDGVMAVDDSGIEHLDELIVDKDTPTEEVYKFFRVNAPYSFFNNSPNHAYGLAIIKSSLRWK